MALTGNLISTGRGAHAGMFEVRAFLVAMLVAAAIVEFLASLLAAATWGQFGKVLALNLILGGAAGLVGAVLGFIFGIPRALTEEAAAPPARIDPNIIQGYRKSKPNTNLEQISDWLTKILVGASLAGLATMPNFMVRFIKYLDANAYKGLPGGGTLALFIAIYFITLGFYWSYIETRTSLTVLFDTYTQDISEDKLLKVRNAPWEPGSAPIPEDAEILNLDPASLTNSALLEARAAAETRAGNFRNAASFYRRALDLDPGNPRLQTRLSLVLSPAGNIAGAESLVQALQNASGGNSVQRNQLEAVRVFTALYKPEPAGFEEAISIGEPLLQTEQASNAMLQLWMACGYGQRLRYARRGRAAEPIAATEPDRVKALACLTDMMRLRPELLSSARSLWRPDQYGGDPGEDDLAVFRDDPGFIDLLGPAARLPGGPASS